MIKIAFVIDTIESPTAGTEKQLLMLIKHLDRTKFQPFLCVLRNSEWLKNDFKECDLVDLKFESFGKAGSYLSILRFTKWLKKQKIDIVQTHFRDSNKVGIISAKTAGVKKIISTRRNQGYWHNFLEKLILRVLNKWVTCFLANSESTKLWAIRNENIHAKRIHVIYNSVEVENFYRASKFQHIQFREELGFPPEAVVIGIIANLRPVKSIDVFLNAAGIITTCCSGIRFIIVGDGPLQQDLERLAASLQIESAVRFLGKRFDVYDILSCIDIGVISSVSESFSNSLIEYMASGLTVVSTAVGGAWEAIEDGKNGYVVPTNDAEKMAEALVRLINTSDRKRMGEYGQRKVISLFSCDAIVRQYEKYYRDTAVV